MLHRAECRRPRPAVTPRDINDVRARFDHADGDRPDAVPGHELHADRGGRMHLLQLVDQLLQILNAVDVVKGRGRNKIHVGEGMARARDIPVHLYAHELPPFTRLCSLRDLDLQLPPRHKVLCGHAEPGRCNLFRVGGDTLQLIEGVLSPLPAVASSSQLAHGENDVALALGAHRSERHCSRPEPCEYRPAPLDFIGRERGSRRRDIEQVSDVHRFGFSPHGDELPVEVRPCIIRDLVAHHPVDDGRTGGRHSMFLSHRPARVFAELVRVEELLTVLGACGKSGLLEYVLRQFLIADPTEGSHDPREEVVHQFAPQTDRREELGAHVALYHGDPDLGHDLQEPRFERVQIVPLPDLR